MPTIEVVSLEQIITLAIGGGVCFIAGFLIRSLKG